MPAASTASTNLGELAARANALERKVRPTGWNDASGASQFTGQSEVSRTAHGLAASVSPGLELIIGSRSRDEMMATFRLCLTPLGYTVK